MGEGEQDFARALEAAASRTPGTLAATLAAWPNALERLSALALHARPGEPYGRRVLHDGALGEVLLVRWRGELPCAPHDHGDAHAVVCVLSGTITEQRFEFDGTRLACVGEQRITPPSQVEVPARVIHAVQGSEGALGLHFYLRGPRDRHMRLYDAGARRTLVVDDDAGAWLPRSPEHALEVVSWP